MHADLEKIVELERVDSEIARLKAEIAALPQRVAAIEKKLAGTQAQLEAAKAAIKQNEANRRKAEGDIQALQQKISKYRDQSLSVKTNQEYKALQDEITFAENEIRKLEDKILDGMVDAENREKDVKAAEGDLAAERKLVEKEQNDARSRTAEDQDALASLEPRRKELRQSIAEAHLQHYDRIMRSRGSATAAVRDEKCTACYVMLRPQVHNDVLVGTQVINCDSCGRFLYMSETSQPESEPQKAGSEQL